MGTAGMVGMVSMAGTGETLRLSIKEARGVMLAAQRLLHPPAEEPGLDDLRAVIDELGAVQIDTISVIERSQYLVLWSRLGAYDPALFDALLATHRDIFEYWSHAASIVPMADYPYYRMDMLRAADDHLWSDLREWKARNPDVLQQTLEAIRARGALASADFEKTPGAQRASPWDWYGPKESRKALDILYTTGDLMISGRRGGQKLYDLRERVLAEAFGADVPRDDALPSPADALHHFVGRTIRALGIVTPSWLWDYFRLNEYYRLASPHGETATKRGAARALLDARVREGTLLPATVEGLSEPAYLAPERLLDLEWLRAGNQPRRTTLLSPFDSLIWHRERTRTLFEYEVCFEAYIVPEKRRYGYYCLAILHQGRIVGRLDLKMHRAQGELLVRAAYLEPGVAVDDELLDGLAGALRELARFLGGETITVERSEPRELAVALRKRVAVRRRANRASLPQRRA